MLNFSGEYFYGFIILKFKGNLGEYFRRGSIERIFLIEKFLGGSVVLLVEMIKNVDRFNIYFKDIRFLRV